MRKSSSLAEGPNYLKEKNACRRGTGLVVNQYGKKEAVQ